MISMNELLKGKKLEDQDETVQENLKNLLDKLNQLRDAYGSPLTVTSGLRTLEDQLRVYAGKGITDIKKIPMKSKHLEGLACDFSDPDCKLKLFINENLPLIESLGLYMEDFKTTSNWVHVQIVPPASGRRFFVP